MSPPLRHLRALSPVAMVMALVVIIGLLVPGGGYPRAPPPRLTPDHPAVVPRSGRAPAVRVPLGSDPGPPPWVLGRARRWGIQRKPGAMKNLKAAVKFFNRLLQLMFTAGDMFGSYTPPQPHSALKAVSRGGGDDDDDDDDDKGEDEDDIIEYLGESSLDFEEVDTGSYEGLDPDIRVRRPWSRSQMDSVWANPTLLKKEQRGRKKMLNFTTRYSVAVNVANSTLIEPYMQLPFEEYSLLDQSFISRVEGNVFRFMVPANELVGIETVPVVDVKVEVDPQEKVLSISSISSRLVSRSRDGTIIGTYNVNLLSNNSLNFSVSISYGEDRWRVPGVVGPRQLAKNIRKSLFGGGNHQQQSQNNNVSSSSSSSSSSAPPSTADPPRRLRCSARVNVGMLLPPPFSLLPRLMARQGGSLILGYIVNNLVNRFLDLLIEDYYRWAKGDPTRTTSIAPSGGLLGYQPERYRDRILDLEDKDAEEESDEEDDNDEPIIDYMI